MRSSVKHYAQKMGLPYTQDYSSDNPLPIRADHETAYGEIITANIVPYIQATPVYNVLPANWTTVTATGGSAAATGQEFVCQTGTSAGGYGVIRSVRSVNYHAGFGSYGRFTGRFTTGVANSLQGIGLFNVGDTLAFGYDGDEFGIIHQYGGFAEVRTITVTAGSSGSTNLTLTLNSVGYTIPLTAGTTAHNAWQIAVWLEANQTVWSASQNGATVVLLALSDGAKSGTYTYSHATSTGTIAQNTAGVTKTTAFYQQTNWNLNRVSWLDPTKGNMYAIQYNCGRYGSAEFFVADQNSGRMIPVHFLNFTNIGTTPALSSYSLRIGRFAASLGSTTNLTTAAGCMSGFSEGSPRPIRNPRAYSRVLSVGTSLTNVFTLRCREVFSGVPNQTEIQPMILTAFTESAKGATVVLYGNATVAGEPNFSYVSQNTLVSEIDIAGTTISAGTPIMEFVIAANSSQTINLTDLYIRIPPTISITFGMKVNSGAASDSGIGVSWYEDV